jgi:hypothetical protein
MKISILVAALISALPWQSVAIGEPQALVLDCPVSKASPLFDLADFHEGAALILTERYRFIIQIGERSGFASTPRATNIPAQVAESSSLFQIDFENKRVVIDRMTAEFHVFIQSAQQPFGSGTCSKIEQRKF